MFYSSGALACLLPPFFLKRRVSLTRKPLSLFSPVLYFFLLTYFFLRISIYPIHLLELKKLWAGVDGREIGWDFGACWVFLIFFCPCAEFFFHGNDMSFGGFPRQSIIDDCHLFIPHFSGYY